MNSLSYDAINKDSNKCVRYFSYYEKKHEIPKNLLKSVSMVESGLWHDSIKKTLPWPWTINYRGKGYFFKDKRSAINAVKMIFENGEKSVDVGCMQINLHHHKNAFVSLEQAFDPKNNVEYGAKFLKSNYARTNNWKLAVAKYHSENKQHGVKYSHKVLHKWKKELLQNKDFEEKYRNSMLVQSGNNINAQN